MRPQHVAFIALAALKLFLVSPHLVGAIGGSPHDDQLFVTLAEHLVRLKWLGPYDELTLIKGPGYPAFIALNHVLGLPLLFSQELFFIGAVAVLARTLRYYVRSRLVLWALIVVCMFSPITYWAGAYRVLREGIYASLTMFVFATCVGIVGSAEHGVRKATYGWGLALGISFLWFWLTREEGIWILPSLGLILLYGVWRASRRAGRGALASLSVPGIIVPAAIWATGTGGVALTNKIHYGIFAVTEFQHDAYPAAYGSLLRVRDERPVQYLRVPRHVRETVYAVSPAFAELRPYLETPGAWQHGCAVYSQTCGDMATGWFMWAFRSAAARAGHHKSGEASINYYLRVRNEIDAACRDKVLSCDPARPATVNTFTLNDAAQLPPFISSALRVLVFANGFEMRVPTSMGDEAHFPLFADVTHGRLAPTTGTAAYRVSAGGWLYRPSNPPFIIDVLSAGSPTRDVSIRYLASEDIMIGSGDPSAGMARFDIRGSCAAPCVISFRDQTGVFAQLDAARSNLGRQNLAPPVTVYFDRYSFDAIAATRLTPLDAVRAKVSMLTTMAHLYRRTLGPLTVVCIAIFAPLMVLLVRRGNTAIPVIATASLLATAARVLMLSMIAATQFPAISSQYISAAVPLVLIFDALALACLVECFPTVRSFIRDARGNNGYHRKTLISLPASFAADPQHVAET
jgi:hypothetical protein